MSVWNVQTWTGLWAALIELYGKIWKQKKVKKFSLKWVKCLGKTFKVPYVSGLALHQWKSRFQYISVQIYWNLDFHWWRAKPETYGTLNVSPRHLTHFSENFFTFFVFFKCHAAQENLFFHLCRSENTLREEPLLTSLRLRFGKKKRLCINRVISLKSPQPQSLG